MEENFNKKSILILFLLLIILFLFIYKGIVLSGNEYYDAYISYQKIASNTTTVLKKAKIIENNTKFTNKKMVELLSNFDDENQALTSIKHALVLKHEKILNDLNKLIDNIQISISNNSNKYEMKEELINIRDNFNLYENQHESKSEGDLLEEIIDKLEANISSMRAYFNKINN